MIKQISHNYDKHVRSDYAYLGAATVVEVDYPEPDLHYRLFDPSASGDIYTGLDRFGRVIDCRWEDYGSSADAVRIRYGYDRVSNRLWREDAVATSQGKHFDELYAYDGLYRLADMQRGTLNAQKNAVTNKAFSQQWLLDSTDNWGEFKQDDDGNGAWDLDQNRTANPVNEITDIGETTGPAWTAPAYDPAGNMTTLPRPATPTASYTAAYDAWNRLVNWLTVRTPSRKTPTTASAGGWSAKTTLAVYQTKRGTFSTPPCGRCSKSG